MAQRGDRLGFDLEAGDLNFVGIGAADHLQGDEPVEPAMTGLVDDAHSTPAELAQDFVVRRLAGGSAAGLGRRRPPKSFEVRRDLPRHRNRWSCPSARTAAGPGRVANCVPSSPTDRWDGRTPRLNAAVTCDSFSGSADPASGPKLSIVCIDADSVCIRSMRVRRVGQCLSRIRRRGRLRSNGVAALCLERNASIHGFVRRHRFHDRSAIRMRPQTAK